MGYYLIMNSIFDFSNVSDFVASALEERQIRNKNYSLGSFARDLDVSKSILSGVITGKKGMRLVTLNKIIKAKKLNTIEAEYLKCLWMMNFSKSKNLIERAALRTLALRAHKTHVQVNPEDSALLQEWYVLPVFELLCSGRSVEEISKSLDLKADTIDKTITMLVDNNYLKMGESGKKYKFQEHIKFESPTSAANIKNYHNKFLELSSKKLFTVPLERRKFLTSTLTIDSSDIEEARSELEKFLTGFVNKYSKAEDENDVYTLALQFYPLTEGSSNVN